MRLGGRGRSIAGICGLVFAMSAPSAQAADELGQRFVAGEVIVGFERGVGQDARAAARGAVDADLEQRLLLPRTQLLDLGAGESVRSAIATLERRGSVRYAEPNGIVHADAIPSDGGFGRQWGLHNTGQPVPPTGPPTPISGTADADIDAPDAWDVETGDGSSTGPVVAVVDGGVAYDHPELDDNIWSNPGETVNGVDDGDSNPLVDDVRGWDFVTNDPGDPDDSDGTGPADGADNDPADLNGHGTHVAGTLGAEGNNGGNGVAGVNWDTRIMPLRALGVAGNGTDAAIADAFTYAGDEGADIVNASLSGAGAAPQVITDAITGAPNTLFVVAAGNLAQDNDVGNGRYPCNVASANVICVAASDLNDGLSTFSNFGATSVDLAAPGTRIYSTYSRQPGPLPLAEAFPGPALPAGWTTGGANDTWAVTSENGPIGMPPSSLTDSPGANYVASTDSFAQSPAIDLDPGTRCALTYSVELDMNSGDVDDLARIQTSPDVGGPWAVVDAYRGAGARFDRGVDLTAFDGDGEMYLRFNMFTDADATVDNGAWFDNAVVDCGGNTLTFLDGTSMATPMVSGVAALGLSLVPAATVAELRAAILDGADPRPGLSGAVVTGARLNALNTLELLATEPPVPQPPVQPTVQPPVQLPNNGPPDLDLSGKKKQKVGKKLTVKAECDEPCSVTGKGKLKAGGDSFKLKAKPAQLSLGAGETGTLKLKLSAAARGAAEDGGKAKVTVIATDASGLTDKASRKIKLKR